MFKNITIGQYYPASSPLHRLDARLKIIFTIAYIALLFTVNNIFSYIMAAIFMVLLVLISKIPVRFIIKCVKPVLWILIITAVIDLFAVPGESAAVLPVFHLTITREGIYTAITLSARLLFLMTGASLLTLTTPPITLTDALESLMKPLGFFKVPTRDIAMMMSIAIRFIPTFAEEADKIRKAQISRGLDFGEGGIIKRAKATVSILIPLFIGAFRRADELATAMDARCYGGKTRTRLNELHLTGFDALGLTVFVFCALILLAAEFVIEF